MPSTGRVYHNQPHPSDLNILYTPKNQREEQIWNNHNLVGFLLNDRTNKKKTFKIYQTFCRNATFAYLMTTENLKILNFLKNYSEI